MTELNPEYQKLIDAVEVLETDKDIKNYDLDRDQWSERIEEAILKGEEKISQKAELFKNYIPNFDQYLKQEILLYRQEVEQIHADLKDKIEDSQFMIDDVIRDLLDGIEVPRTSIKEKHPGLKNLIEEKPRFFWENIDRFTRTEHSWDLIQKALEIDPVGAIENIAKYKDEPYAEEIMGQAVRKVPATYLRFYSDYALFRREMIEIAVPLCAKRLPEMTIRRFEKFQRIEPMAQNVAIQLARRVPGITLTVFESQYKDCPYKIKILKIAIKFALEKDADALVREWEVYKDIIPGAKKYLSRALEKANPKVAIDFIEENYSNLKSEPIILRKIFFRAAKSYPVPLLRINSELPKIMMAQPYATEVINIAFQALAKIAPHLVVEFWENYKTVISNPGILEEGIIKGIETGPAEIVIKLETYKHLSKAEEYLKQASTSLAEKDPWSALTFINWKTSEKRPYLEFLLEECFRDLAEMNPGTVIQNLYMIKEKKYCEEVLTAALQKFAITQPYEFTKLTGFDDRPDWSELIKIARRRYAILEQLQKNNQWRDDEDLMEDPALTNVHLIEPSWLPNLTGRGLVDFMTFVARNLYIQSQEISKSNVQKEYKRTLELRDKLGEVPLFYHRNIVVASHLGISTLNPGVDLFANELVLSALRRQQGFDFQFSHHEAPEATFESLQKTKSDTLESIVSSPSPLTFVWSGHGGPEAIYFADGLPETVLKDSGTGVNKITAKEFAQALIRRSEKVGKENLSKDIFIFNACYNHTFIRDVYSRLESKDCGKPWMIGESEYNQLGLDNSLMNKFNNVFFRDVLDLDGERTKLKHLWENDSRGNTNPSVYIPGEGGYPLQISQADSAKLKDKPS